MTRPLAVVLWEDSLSVGAKTFGPHQLALACVIDQIGAASDTDRWTLGQIIIGIPRRGNSRLRTSLGTETGLLTRSGEHLVTVFDDDQVRRLYRLETQACKTIVLEAIRNECSLSTLEIVLLEQNVESLVAAAARALSRPNPERKDPKLRDAVLMQLAAEATCDRRDRVRTEVPSFDRLVTILTRLVGADLR